MKFKSYSLLRDYRSYFLDLAVKDTKKWCVLPDQLVEARKHSDQHWIQLFTNTASQPISGDDARRFLITFMLIRASWKVEDVAKAMNQFASIHSFNPIGDIPAFATQLRGMNILKRRQTSAASKIANFMYPNAKVYIWDALATKSARLRDHERVETKRCPLGIYTKDKEHDYARFHAACTLAHEDENAKSDFKEAVAHLDAHFKAQGGPLANREKVSIDFIKRRLLDKLMFWEGWAVDRKALPTHL
ncbi:hypothetical protein [Acetobacter cerevisiae]|uniref:hypothetical protein n=1 Tax=Acetobacter cerevisiae TaxID=178900 RepID=UPI00209DCCBD|nr:hypothetical protein [Acetobacter cerevisiae]MCP1269966.1 hypothetical protein [Acetobacter cerevisiae]MCP1277835.1 hypothetical protein [Acetobacter cerevisiae]